LEDRFDLNIALLAAILEDYNVNHYAFPSPFMGHDGLETFIFQRKLLLYAFILWGGGGFRTDYLPVQPHSRSRQP